MSRTQQTNMKRIRHKLNDRKGMTMAEILTTVAIILILAAVAFITLTFYQRSMAQVERDGIAKEIFIAAQNHLTMAKGEGYLSVTKNTDADDYTNEKTKKVYGYHSNSDPKGVYYFLVNGGDAFTDDNSSMIDLMLPFGSIDETVRLGGSYIIRYQPKTATVLDVFYCSISGSPQRFNHTLSTTEYDTLVSGYRDTVKQDGTVDSKKTARRTYDDGSVLGWYGSALASGLPTVSLTAPVIKVVNGDTLHVEIKDSNPTASSAEIKLIITGLTSDAKKAIKIKTIDGSAGGDTRLKTLDDGTFVYFLDDITQQNMHFGEIIADTRNKGKQFIAGEDIRIEVVAYRSNAFANIAYSSSATTNSLYEGIAKTEVVDVRTGGVKLYPEKTMHAYVSSIRHLENLDSVVSSSGFTIAAASQTDDLDYEKFIGAVSYDTKPQEGTNGSEVFNFVKSDRDDLLAIVMEKENKILYSLLYNNNIKNQEKI